LYAIFDEIHQSFVPGRNAWWVDVAIDSIAAALALGVASWWRSRNQKSGQL
jgi:VanZ family protein